ncbi:MAG: polysaccharide biosynthesis/export family protein [Paracoccaceae bacterium]
MARIFLSALMLIILGSVASAQELYKIHSGDVLRVEVLEDQSLNRNALVLPDGTVTIPLIGSVPAAGQTLGAVQSAIAAGLAPNFASAPNVFVTIVTLTGARGPAGPSSVEVYIMGEVNNPGKAQVAAGTSLLQFLAESGGFSKFAAKKRVQLRRTNAKTGETVVFRFDYKAIENGSASVNSIVLQHGDVIVVPERRLFE